jgi:hypothetical protein
MKIEFLGHEDYNSQTEGLKELANLDRTLDLAGVKITLSDGSQLFIHSSEWGAIYLKEVDESKSETVNSNSLSSSVLLPPQDV